VTLDSRSTGQDEQAADQEVQDALAPARWLLDAAANGGVPLTQTHALARAVVREAAERWPHWWDAELFGPPHREADMPLLGALHEGLRRLRLVRRRGRKLHATVAGRKLLEDPAALLYELAQDLGGEDAFTDAIAEAVIDRLIEGTPCTREQLDAPALRRALDGGWRDSTGQPPGERDVSWVVGEVLCRAVAYGLIERTRAPDDPRRWRSLVSLTPAGQRVLGRGAEEVNGQVVLVFDAELVSGLATPVRKVGALVAVASHEHLSALHDAIQQAFGWGDDHLYSFWLDGRFWGEKSAELVRPGTPDSDSPTADVPMAELDIDVGARIAYVFDYGDEWRVLLTLRERREDGEPLRRVIERRGTAPRQYPPLEDE
jgi:DNA-binding PadR family transcriptional regulator